jgi:methionyl-tRNA formyltransferase
MAPGWHCWLVQQCLHASSDYVTGFAQQRTKGNSVRILFMGNNWVGLQILRRLKDHDADLVGLVVHPVESSRYGAEIIEAAVLDEDRIFLGSQLKDQDTIESIKSLKPDIGLSILFGYILKPEFLELFGHGVVNLHPSYLPFNRGRYPNVWSIVDETPAGVTLHYVDDGIDTGDIIARREVLVEPVDTGETLYRKLEEASVSLFEETWPLIEAGEAPRFAQEQSGTFHRTGDVEQIDRIELDKSYTAGELLNIIRARTFPPYDGAYFEIDGRRIYVRLELYDAEEL